MADKYYEIKKILVDKIEELESIADDMSADRNVDPSKAAFAATDVYILKKQYENLFGEPWYCFHE